MCKACWCAPIGRSPRRKPFFCEAALSAITCHSCKLPCFPWDRATCWFSPPMEDERISPEPFPPSRIHKGPRTEFSSPSLTEATTPSYWPCAYRGFIDETGRSTKKHRANHV